MDYQSEGKQYKTEPRPTVKEQRDFNASYELLLKCRRNHFTTADARREAERKSAFNSLWYYQRKAKKEKI